ncbi:MAG: beta-N-acetylhexosaminidase, partial [Gemmatimonadota bacterium]|nr:beta-N-acetylhexosaminidase [Gemmatimonadota bacterium]
MKRFMMLLLLISALPLYSQQMEKSPLSVEESPLWRAGVSLIPYPQEVNLGGEDFQFGSGVAIILDEGADESDRFAAGKLAARLKEDWGIEANIRRSSSEGEIILTRQGAPEKVGEQGYQLETSARRITVRARGSAGLFYGVQTLLQVIQKGRLGLYVMGVEIIDWPDIPVRAVHYDTKHFQEKRDYVENFIRTLAGYKINMLIWEWEDKFAYKSHPEIGAPGAFTMVEMQKLTRFARSYHVQIVPLVQGLGHVSYILKHPQHKHLRELASSNWQFCPLKEGTYELMFDLYEEAIRATPGSEYIHIGCDEAFPWDREVGVACGCKAKVEEIGHYGLKQIFLERCASYVKKLGRRAMAWDWPEELKPENKIKPPPGLTLFSTSHDRDMVQKGREAGYPVWYYDLNPGIEHLFLPYFYKFRKGKKVLGCLERSCKLVPTAARLGIFDGMVATSWNCSGVHNQGWMLRYIVAAEYSWSGKEPAFEEFKVKYFKN